MKRVIAYIDGFNLYHSIDNLKEPHLKWLNLRALVESLLRKDEELKDVKYFSAFANWMPDRAARHRAYVEALKAAGVSTCMSQFKEKPRSCFKCKAKWIGHEEKETDVQIAVHMVSDALRGEVERLIVISADTDLCPAISMIKLHRPECEVFVAAPPKRIRYCRALNPRIEIGKTRLSGCLLPASIQAGPDKAVVRPPTYDPPIR